MNTWHPSSPIWASLFRLPVEIEQRLDALYPRAKALGLCGTRQEFLCCLGELYGLRPGLALSPALITEPLLRCAEHLVHLDEQVQRQHQQGGNTR